MKIDVRMTTKHDSLALRRFAEHALGRKLSPRAGRIQRVSIRLSDVNGPKGGVDKVCIVRIGLRGGGEVSVRGESTGWYEAVSLAAMNARSVLDRRVGRQRARRSREASRLETPAEATAPMENESRRQMA